MKRIFIAIDIKNKKALTTLVNSYKEQLKAEKIRWVNMSNIHLTLAFLGDKDKKEIVKTEELMFETAGKFTPFEIEFSRTGVFRDIRHPRVIWLGLTAPATMFELRKYMCDRLREHGLYSDSKPFKPHITLGRMNYITDTGRLSGILEPDRAGSLPSQHVDELVLYESILKPGGPEYHVIARAGLKRLSR